LLADHGSESPWLWLAIVGGGVGLHFVTRALRWPQARSWADVSDRLLGGGSWQIRAVFLAIIGGGSLYHLTTGSYRWFWWLLPVVAWAAFVEVLLSRTGQGRALLGARRR
jgi:hypothetical protein